MWSVTLYLAHPILSKDVSSIILKMEFEEEEHAPHPYTNYNKQPDGSVSTLTGNWVEERALKDVTGTTRYQVITAWSNDVSRMMRSRVHSTRSCRGIDAA